MIHAATHYLASLYLWGGYFFTPALEYYSYFGLLWTILCLARLMLEGRVKGIL